MGGVVASPGLETSPDDTADLDLPPLQSLMISVWAALIGLVCRALDLCWLALRPSLIVPYLHLWAEELRRSPYRWPRSFESRRALSASGQAVREAMYGEAPLFCAVHLFRRAGLTRGGKLVDLGAGRGRPLLAARWVGAEARGLELLSDHVDRSAGWLARAGAHLEVGDAQTADLGDATHVFLNWTGMSPATRARVTERLLAARPGTRFLAVVDPVEGERVRLLSTHRLLFTWGFATVHVQELGRS